MSDETDRLSDMGGDEEAEYYEAFIKGETGSSDEWEEEKPRRRALETREEMKRLYGVARIASVGSKIRCPVCRNLHVKTSYQKVFDRNNGRANCKDRYWNTIDETRSIKAGGARLW